MSKKFTLSFWQLALARVTALFIGLAVGAHFVDAIAAHALWLFVVGVLGSLVLIYSVFWR